MRFGAAKALVTAVLASAALAGCVSPPVGNPAPPSPAKPVDLARYSGVWYELARYDNRFERGCEHATAEYAPLPNGLVRVVNTCWKGPGRSVEVARGRAKPVAGSDGAKLKVSFFGPFFVGDYWVLDHAPDYSWSIVGEPSGRYLWLLARSTSPELREQLIARAAQLGYDTRLIHRTAQ